MATFRRYFNNRKKKGYIFITFVTYNRREILIANIDLFKESIKYTRTKFLFEIFAMAVMQDYKFCQKNWYDINWCNFNDENKINELKFE